MIGKPPFWLFLPVGALAFYVGGLLAYRAKFDGDVGQLLGRFVATWLLFIAGAGCFVLGVL